MCTYLSLIFSDIRLASPVMKPDVVEGLRRAIISLLGVTHGALVVDFRPPGRSEGRVAGRLVPALRSSRVTFWRKCRGIESISGGD